MERLFFITAFMRYIWQHIHTITEVYRGEVPLAHFLKNHFRQHPKLGSRDRKVISDMCYSLYRVGKALPPNIDMEEKVGIALYICGATSKHNLPFIPENLQPAASQLADRIVALQGHIDINKTFPHPITLSAGIDTTLWLLSMLDQPKLFIRIRKDKEKILALLKEQDVPFNIINSNTLSLPNGAPIDKLLPADSYVVQDLSSQRTGAYFQPKPNQQWYDCCSGAGGKSLLLKDMQPTVKLTVTDRRQSILHNLKERFKLYRHTIPTAFVTHTDDATALSSVLDTNVFDGIICDVPCTGSGTWARTPEQLYFFKPEKLHELSVLQTTIATNAAAYLKPGGRFIYITCSIFQQENEDVVAELQKRTKLVLESMQVLNGIAEHADSMFVAVLKHS